MTTLPTVYLGTGQEAIAVRPRKSKRARSICVQVNYQGQAELVVPYRSSLKSALQFLHQHENWLRGKLLEYPSAIEIKDGMLLPLLGKQYRVVATGALRGLPEIEDQRILVPGLPEHFHRRLADFVRAKLEEEIKMLIEIAADAFGERPTAVALREVYTRWGSCTSDGRLAFSWRLAFAPYEIMRYVVFHEVAHLREHNHSQRFWNLVKRIDPDYIKHRTWLQHHGHTLHRYRFPA